MTEQSKVLKLYKIEKSTIHNCNTNQYIGFAHIKIINFLFHILRNFSANLKLFIFFISPTRGGMLAALFRMGAIAHDHPVA